MLHLSLPFNYRVTSTRVTNFKMDDIASTFFQPKYRDTAVNAYKIVSAVFSSQAFQDQVALLSFKCNNYAAGCHILPEDHQRISGQTVLNMLFRTATINDTLHVEESGGALGTTNVGHCETYTYFKQITQDMPELPFTYSLAVNICHEYMHSLGFKHLYCSGPNPFCPHLHERNGQPDPRFYNDDVTYRVGWVVYYILKDKYEHNRPVY